ncbi:MAG: hypothetical protein QUV05_09565 [Phycisphaerae bacterium]|nr:hypothetical protein [Phycisphaerae bacterium]
MFCKGKIVDVRFAAGCVEVIVAGEIPGAFVIDNCCLPGILDTEGPDLIGRAIEYEDGQLQFLEDEPAERPRLIIPFGATDASRIEVT